VRVTELRGFDPIKDFADSFSHLVPSNNYISIVGQNNRESEIRQSQREQHASHHTQDGNGG
jgi:hypothetical protein